MTTTGNTAKGELILYQTEDGRTRVEVRFEGDTAWLSLRRRGFMPRAGGAA